VQVSFIIPLYNCLPLTQAMVASLRATLPRDLACEIILVDDGSTDGTRVWLGTLAAPFRPVFNEGNLGYAAANNRGAEIARGEFLALLNNDLVLTPGWLEPMLALHRRLGPRAGLIGNVQRAVRTGAVDHAGIFINAKGKPEHERLLPGWSWLPGAWRRAVASCGGASRVSTSVIGTAARTSTSACAPPRSDTSRPSRCAASSSTTSAPRRAALSATRRTRIASSSSGAKPSSASAPAIGPKTIWRRSAPATFRRPSKARLGRSSAAPFPFPRTPPPPPAPASGTRSTAKWNAGARCSARFNFSSPPPGGRRRKNFGLVHPKPRRSRRDGYKFAANLRGFG
jgi:hypothetical protein